MVNGTEEKTNEKSEVTPEPMQETAPEQVGPYVGGEIHIFADAKTGAMKISSPPNLLICLGILETAKIILTQQHIAKMEEEAKKSAPPAIVRAVPGDLKGLMKPGELKN